MKSMIDVFKKELQDGMEIVKCKEMANVYKITLSYNGMTGTCELNKMCAPNTEKSLCRKSIDTAVSGMYINAGNLIEAKSWLDGEKWDNINKKKEFVIEVSKEQMEWLRVALEREVDLQSDEGDNERANFLYELLEKIQ